MNGRLIHCARRLLPAWVAGLAFFLPHPNRATAQTTKVPLEQGTHAFRFILNRLGLKPLTELSQLEQNPENSILIVFGETQVLDDIPDTLKAFLDKGGAVLVATDRDQPGKWQELFQIDFKQAYVRAPAELAYRNNEECPFFVTKGEDPPIFRTLNHVASNRPIYFTNESKKLKTLATSDPRCWVKTTWRNRVGRLLGEYPFAAGGEFGKGRVLVLSDHSVFINEMMIQTDNDNFEFASQCVDWLRGEGETKRTHVLLLDEGETVTNFDVPVTDVPMPPISVINQMLAKMEQENLFNKIALGENLTERFPNVLRALVVALTTALAGFACYRFLMARHVVDPKEPLFSAKVAKQTPDVAVTVQRHSAMIKADNFWEAAHHLARDWFLANVPGAQTRDQGSGVRSQESGVRGQKTGVRGQESGVRKQDGRTALLTPDPWFLTPEVDAGWWRRRSWMKKVQAIWQIATGSPRRLPASEFARFVTDFEEVKSALAKGALHLKTKAD